MRVNNKPDNRLPPRLFATDRFPSNRLNIYSKPDILPFIQHVLRNTKELQYIKDSCFGKLFELPARQCPVSCKLIHAFLTRQLLCEDSHTLWTVFGCDPIRFGLQEFGTITGLPCGEFPTDYDTGLEDQSKANKDPDWIKLIGKKKQVTIADLRHKLETDQRMPGWKKLQLALILIVDGVLIAHQQKTRPTLKYVKMVQNVDAFCQHPWGRESFLKTITCMKPPKDCKDPRRELVSLLRQESFRLKGFPLALQLLAFQAVPQLQTIIPAPPDPISISQLEEPHLPLHSNINYVDILRVEAEENLAVTSLIPIQSQTQPGWGVWPDVVVDERVTYMESLIANQHPFKKHLWLGGDRSGPILIYEPPEEQPAPKRNALKPRKTLNKPSSSDKQRRISSYFPRTASTSNSNDQLLEMLTKISTQVSKMLKEQKAVKKMIKRRKPRSHSKRSGFQYIIFGSKKAHLSHRGCQTDPMDQTSDIPLEKTCPTPMEEDQPHCNPPIVNQDASQPMEEDQCNSLYIPDSTQHTPFTPNSPKPTTPVHNSPEHTIPIHNPIEHTIPIHNSIEHTSPIHNPIEHTSPIHNPIEHTIPIHNPIEHTIPVHNPVEHISPTHTNPIEQTSPEHCSTDKTLHEHPISVSILTEKTPLEEDQLHCNSPIVSQYAAQHYAQPESTQHTSPAHNSPTHTPPPLNNSPERTTPVRTSPLPTSSSGTPPLLYTPKSPPAIYRSYNNDAADHPNSPPFHHLLHQGLEIFEKISSEASSLDSPQYDTSTRRDSHPQHHPIIPETSLTTSSGFAEHAVSVNAFAATATSKRVSIPILNFDQSQENPAEGDCVEPSDSSLARPTPRHRPSDAECNLAAELFKSAYSPALALLPPLEETLWDLFYSTLQPNKQVFHITPSKFDFSNQFILQISEPQQWVTTFHMEILMFMLSGRHREMLQREKQAFTTPYLASGIQEIWKRFKPLKRKDIFQWPERLTEMVLKPGKKWMEEVMTIYTPMNWDDKHWVGLAINLDMGYVEILDPQPSLNTDTKVARFMEPVLTALPYLIKKVAKPQQTQFRGLKPFYWKRTQDIYINARSGDCGPVSIKFMELHAYGDPIADMARITDNTIDELRKQYAMDVYKTIVLPAYHAPPFP